MPAAAGAPGGAPRGLASLADTLPVRASLQPVTAFLTLLLLLAAPLAEATPAKVTPAAAPQSESPSSEPPPAAPAADQPVPTPARAASPAARELIRATLAADIASAGYYELVAELRQLGLDDAGRRDQLQARLRRFYGLPDAEPPTREAAQVVEVLQASHAEYYTNAETGETQVTLRGSVEVAVQNADEDTVHLIRADEVLYHRDAELLSARGGVEYVVTRAGGEPQSVRAASLAFDLAISKAVFVNGTTQHQRDAGAGPVTFTFAGETITRLADETIILDGARVTSSPNPDLPNYEIRAQRMWLLAPGEWALQGATLSVGRVPVLYLPFFFLPGDEVVFHPALGVREREGMYLNTTLYLIGRRPREAAPLSVLSLTDPGQYREELRGLFLRKVAADATPAAGRYLKVMLDGYARLGVFAGIAGELPVAETGKIDFHVGAARSRSIFGPPGYTAYRNGRSYWHESSLFGATIPLRYALELATDVPLPYASLRAGFELFSDPDFLRDFGNRQERFDWPALVGFEADRGEVPARRSNLTWEINTRADFSPLLAGGGAGPRLIDQLRLNNAGVRWLWRSRESSLSEEHDPTRSFYFPATLRVPVFAQMGGTLLQLPAADAGPEEQPDPLDLPGSGLRPLVPATDQPPAGVGASQGATATAAGEPRTALAVAASPGLALAAGGVGEPTPISFDARRPELRNPQAVPARAPVPPLPEAAVAKVSYDLRPGVTVEQTFDSATWQTAEQVDFAARSVTVQATHTTLVKHDLDLYGGVVGLDNSLRHSITLQRLVGPPDALTECDAQEKSTCLAERIRRGSRTTVSMDNRLTLRPFRGSPAWANSAVTYDLDLRLLNIAHEDCPKDGCRTGEKPRTRWGSWDVDGVTQHRLQALAVLQVGDHPQRLTLSADLPPRALSLSARLALDAGFLSASAATGFRCEDEELTLRDCRAWKPEPLNLSTRVTPFEPVSLRQQLTIDLSKSAVTRSASSLQFGGLSADLVALPPQTDKPLELQQLRLGYAETSGPHYLWRNRINVEFATRAGWTVNFQKLDTSRFTFTTALTLGIHEFIDLSFATASSNDHTSCYFSAQPEIPCSTRNPLQDLWWSFAFWDADQRRQSNFKADRISLSAVHHLQDWDLTFEYVARPEPQDDGYLAFTSEFSIFVQWLPVPEIRSRLRGDADTFSIRE